MKKSLGAKTLLFPTPVLIVGTYDQAGRPNAAAVAWGGICGSKPPCVNISLREATYSFGNILQRKAFTVNIPSQQQVKAADYFGLASGRDTDKFKKTGLTPVKSSLVDAPYIAEFPLVLECSLLKSVNIGLHTIFVGEVKDVKADAAVLDAQGIPDIARIAPMSFNPATRSYYATGPFLAQAFSVGAQV